MNGLLFISHQTERYSYLESIQMALEGGCRLIQLRMKDAPIREVESISIQVKELCKEYNASLFIDDYVDICLKINATGVHLGKLDRLPSEARDIVGPDFIIGGTANTFEDIIRLYKQGVDYIGLGPFRFTTTKKSLSPILGLEGYHSIISSCNKAGILLPIVAIGGITIHDIPDILNKGVSAIALSSTILMADDPISETRNIINQINRYQ